MSVTIIFGDRFKIIVGNTKSGERTISFYSNRKAGFGYDSQNYIYNQPLDKSVPQTKTKGNKEFSGEANELFHSVKSKEQREKKGFIM